MKLLFLDFETQSDDPASTNPTEVGALLVERTEREGEPDFWEVKHELSSLIYLTSYPPQTEEIIAITGITDEMLIGYGLPPSLVFGNLSPLIAEADYVLAHNVSFDRGVYEATCARLRHEVAQPKKGWLCTIQDVPWAKKFKCKKLSHLAYDNHIVVDPSTLHRALDDVKLLFELIKRCSIPFNRILEYANTPWVFLRAKCRAPWEDGGVQTGQAKKLGYGWEKVWGTQYVFPKCWVKRVKETEIETEKQLAPFPLTRLLPGPETPTV